MNDVKIKGLFAEEGGAAIKLGIYKTLKQLLFPPSAALTGPNPFHKVISIIFFTCTRYILNRWMLFWKPHYEIGFGVLVHYIFYTMFLIRSITCRVPGVEYGGMAPGSDFELA